jgi:flagellar biogenesis protein FliO
MKRRFAAIALIVVAAAVGAPAQDSPVAAENESQSASADTGSETAALDAAWTMLESKPQAEAGRTIKRRNTAAKPDAAAAKRAQPAASGSWLRSVGSLAAVVAVILFLAWGAKGLARGGPLAGRAKRPGVIEIISRTALSPKQSLCLIRVGQRMVLVGVSQDALRTLDVIQDPHAVAALAGEATAARSSGDERAFRQSLEKEVVQYDLSQPAAGASGNGASDVRQRLSDALARVKGAARRA